MVQSVMQHRSCVTKHRKSMQHRLNFRGPQITKNEYGHPKTVYQAYKKKKKKNDTSACPWWVTWCEIENLYPFSSPINYIPPNSCLEYTQFFVDQKFIYCKIKIYNLPLCGTQNYHKVSWFTFHNVGCTGNLSLFYHICSSILIMQHGSLIGVWGMALFV